MAKYCTNGFGPDVDGADTYERARNARPSNINSAVFDDLQGLVVRVGSGRWNRCSPTAGAFDGVLALLWVALLVTWCSAEQHSLAVAAANTPNPQPATLLSGTLLDGTGAPKANVPVLVQGKHSALLAITNSGGGFSAPVDLQPAGLALLGATAIPDGDPFVQSSLTFSAGETDGLVGFVLDSAAQSAVPYVDFGSGLPGTQIVKDVDLWLTALPASQSTVTYVVGIDGPGATSFSVSGGSVTIVSTGTCQ